jgi:hypothetical protein
MNEIHELIIEAHIDGVSRSDSDAQDRLADRNKQIEKSQLVEDVVRQAMQRLRDEMVNDNGSVW